MVYVFVFIFGAIVGSFLNVVILRLNTGESVIYPGSRCFSCGKKLSWHELIPIFSFLIQRGRCRQCGSRIARQYPTVEFLTGLVFLLVAWKVLNLGFGILDLFRISDLGFRIWLSLVYYWLIFGLLIIIAIYDLRHQIISNKIVYLLIFLAFSRWLLIDRSLASLLAGIAFFAFFGLLWLASRGKWMGLGDAKLALGIGWLLGFPAGIIAMLLSFWLGAIFSIFLLLFTPKKFTLKSKIPFGPFLILGILTAFLLSEQILEIYSKIFI